MADDQLKNLVLQRAEDDEALTDDAKLVVMAALESDDDLADVLAAGETAVERVAQLNARIDDSAAPAGAYLRSISVQGFPGDRRQGQGGHPARARTDRDRRTQRVRQVLHRRGFGACPHRSQLALDR